MNHYFGALKPKVDKRDYLVAAGASELPPTFAYTDLSPVKNQRSVSSCVAHATAVILEMLNKTETGKFIPMSTNFIYGMQGIEFNRLDKGMYLRDACKIVEKYGDAPEALVNGNTEQPKCTEELKETLTEDIYNKAKTFRILSYAKCKTDDDIKHALINYGPVLGSINWHKECKFDSDGTVHFDKTSKHGRHAIVIYGYNEKGWLCQNSWGKNWNKGGRFIYPYEDGLNEAWSFVDANNDDIHIPKNNSLLDIFYKAFNFIINLFKGRG